jgi:hypothetical protein
MSDYSPLRSKVYFTSFCGRYRIYWNEKERTAIHSDTFTGKSITAKWTLNEVKGFIKDGEWIGDSL